MSQLLGGIKLEADSNLFADQEKKTALYGIGLGMRLGEQWTYLSR